MMNMKAATMRSRACRYGVQADPTAPRYLVTDAGAGYRLEH
jgi:hypothetical protein